MQNSTVSCNREKGTFGFTILGSGSKGNACVIHGPSGKFLLDAGFSCKELQRRLTDADIFPEEIQAILVTHEHIDHVHGCRVFADTYDIPVYVTSDTCLVMECKKLAAEKRVLITPGQKFQLCGLTVEPFSVCHDVADAVAYVFHYQDKKFGYATDLGIMNLLVKTKLHDCNALVIESNYEPVMLKNSNRPLQTKRRIMSRIGHLSNEDCMSALPELLTDRSKRLVFAHLSEECNDPDLVFHLAQESLLNMNRNDVTFQIASQMQPMDTYWIDR